MKTLDDIVDVFELLGDWEQRYQYLVELGANMPEMPDKYKTDENKVKGCMSQVWVYAYIDADNENKLHYHGDSDTSIIKGVLAVLIELVDSRTAEDIQNLDVDEFFTKLKLDENLSPNRHVGIYAIVDLMMQQAKKLQQRKTEVV